MRDETTLPQRLTTSSVALRFWVLLSGILVLAIFSSTYALRLVALPYLSDYQNRAVVEQTKNAAQHLDERLARSTLLLEFVANDANLINIAMGYTQNDDYFPDLLESMSRPESLSWLSFHDALGDEIAKFDVRGRERELFEETQIADLLNSVIDGQLPKRAPVILVVQNDVTYYVSAVQVKQNGFAEGAIIAGHRVFLEDFFPSSDITRGAHLLTDTAAKDASVEFELARLEKLALTLAIAPDVSSVQAASKKLIVHSVVAIAAVLIGAFAVFAVLGRSVIVTPHLRLEIQAQRLEEQKRELAEMAAIAERANDAVLLTDLDGCVLWANPSFERMSGHKVTKVEGQKPGSFLQGDDTDPNTVAKLRSALSARKAVQVEILNYKANGDPYWNRLSISPLRNTAGDVYGFVAITNDVTEARKSHEALVSAKQEIEHQALHDPLTGLPNRRMLDQAFQKRVAVPNCTLTLVRIDLDHFKYVNDTMGHEAGDFVLTTVADILRDETQVDDLAVRVGGDEFVLLLEPSACEEDGLNIANRILERVKEPMQFEGKTVRVGASFGVAGLGSGMLKYTDLIVGADAALYEAKEAGRNRVHLYTPELHRNVLNRREIARELRLAVGRNEFEPFFQPQMDAQTHEIVGVETLGRWRSSAFGLVGPGRFLPVAKQLSIIEDIDNQIFAKAIDQICALRNKGVPLPKLSFNVTASRVKDPAIFDIVKNLPANAPRIAFEVLESVLVEEQSSDFLFGLDLLRDAGVEIEVDDFGSGHASIVGLMHMRPDTMKIDQRLVMPILHDPLARGLLERIVSMAELMDLSVIAEGVETMQHARVLADIGCHTLQGFAFCKPMPVAELQRFVASRKSVASG